MQISVVIPAFNRAHTLPRALDSVAQQTLAPAEVVVVDDGSTDGTSDLLATCYPSVTRLRQENRGVSAARNRGILHATSPWIALLDSDDSWQPNKLAWQSEAVRDTDFHLCHTGEIWIREGRQIKQKPRHAKSGGWIFRKCLPLCAVSPSAVLIHRSVFNEIGLFDEALPACEDYDFWLRVCARYRVQYVDEPLTIKYGGHADQLSQRFWGMDRFRIIALEKALNDSMLTGPDREAVLRVLLEKLSILRSGALKRNKAGWVSQLDRKYQSYKIQLGAMTGEQKIA